VESDGLVERGEGVETVGTGGAYGETEIDFGVGADACGHGLGQKTDNGKNNDKGELRGSFPFTSFEGQDAGVKQATTNTLL
jgi:hypothetical protein